MESDFNRIQTAAVVSSYVPRRCGIATFAKDLRDAVAAELSDDQVCAVAMDDIPESYEYPGEVRFQIPDHLKDEYANAADMLNVNQIDVTFLQQLTTLSNPLNLRLLAAVLLPAGWAPTVRELCLQ